MPSVLLICGHVGIETITAEGMCDGRDWQSLSRGTGSSGEQAWTGNLGPTLADALKHAGFEVAVTDAVYHKDLYTRPWDLVIALHYQRDRPTARAFAAQPTQPGYISDAAAARAKKWLDRFNNEYSVVTGIPVTPEAVSVNMTDYYGWCYVPSESAAVLIECGHADLDAATLFESGIARVVRAITVLTSEWAVADMGWSLGAPATVVPTPVIGDAFPLASFPVRRGQAGPGVEVPHLVTLDALDYAVKQYSEGRAPANWGGQAYAVGVQLGIRPDVMAALAMHETGRFLYGGHEAGFSADPTFNNFGGIKTTDGTATHRFLDMQHGLIGLAAHLAWYAYDHHTDPLLCASGYDPRHFASGHKVRLNTLADFGNGVWNTGGTYGPALARHLAPLRALMASYVPLPAPGSAEASATQEAERFKAALLAEQARTTDLNEQVAALQARIEAAKTALA